MPNSIEDRVSYLHQRDPSVDRRFRPRPNEKFNLYNAIKEDDQESSTETESISSTSETEATVYLRLRPTDQRCQLYGAEGSTFIVKNLDNGHNSTNSSERHFQFTNIFDESTSQRELYNFCVRPYIENEGNLTVLTYGTSGSGKTYTMHGTDIDTGIIRRAIQQIFSHYKPAVSNRPGMKFDRGHIGLVGENLMPQEDKLRSRYTEKFSYDEYESIRSTIDQEHDFKTIVDTKNNPTVFVWVSFAEIYNENVYDLLNVDKNKYAGDVKRKNLKIISNEGNAYIKDITTVHVRTARDAHAVLNFGLEQVKFASTNVNQHSSRSHCIFIINIVTFVPPNDFEYSTLKFCDLAGSERLKKTENVGLRLKEAQRINTSLMVLGRCLDATYQNQQNKHHEVVPFRDSKLTTLLQASLLGQEKILTIVNMCPTKEFFEENMNVLNFSSMAHKIVYTVPKPVAIGRPNNRSTRFSWIRTASSPQANKTSSEMDFIVAENIRLEDEIAVLRDIIEKQHVERVRNEQQIRTTLVEGFEEQTKVTTALWEKRIQFQENTFTTQVKDLEDQIRQLKSELNKYKQEEEVIDIEDEDEDDEIDDENAEMDVTN